MADSLLHVIQALMQAGAVPSVNRPTLPQANPIRPVPEPVYASQWDRRPDGTLKADGFFGALQVPGTNQIASEYSLADSEQMKDARGNYLDYPSLVPTLTREEVAQVLDAARNGRPVPPSVARKAEAYALQRKAAGLSPFAGAGDQTSLYPDFQRVPVIRGGQ